MGLIDDIQTNKKQSVLEKIIANSKTYDPPGPSLPPLNMDTLWEEMQRTQWSPSSFRYSRLNGDVIDGSNKSTPAVDRSLIERLSFSLSVLDLYLSEDCFRNFVDKRGGREQLLSVVRDEFRSWRKRRDDAIPPPRFTSTESDCKSPIEVAFLAACHAANLDPHCQYPAGRFFLDFAFPDDRLAVELDGHEFHKTKEQRTADAQRQRWLEMNGWRVIRFTGTEIHCNAASCVRQTAEFLAKIRGEHGSNA